MSRDLDTAFVEVGPEGGHRMKLGGLTLLERTLRSLCARGVRRAVVLADPLPLPDGLGLAVEWAAAGTGAPSGVPVVRGDEVAGIRVVDELSRRRAEWALLKTLPKSFQGPVDALLNWRASLRLTRLLCRTALSPNHVTLFATAVGICACALALRGTQPWPALGGLLLQLHCVLDSCDGELARLKQRQSRLGQWLDNVTDDLVDGAFVACASLGAGGRWAVLGTTGAALRLLGELYVYVTVYRRTGTGDINTFRWWFEKDKTLDEVYDRRRALTWLRALGRRDTYVLIFMGFCLCSLPQVVAVYGGVAGLTASILIAQQIRHA